MTERELERQARHRLAVLRHVEEVSGNVAATCRYYGISRNCYYKWLRRYEAEGLAGLRDRSSRPHCSPRAAQAEVIEKIIWLRKHNHFGPEKIAMYLQRYHDVAVSARGTACFGAREQDSGTAVSDSAASRASSTAALPPTGRRRIIGHPRTAAQGRKETQL